MASKTEKAAYPVQKLIETTGLHPCRIRLTIKFWNLNKCTFDFVLKKYPFIGSTCFPNRISSDSFTVHIL
jgi:hypothetical protein